MNINHSLFTIETPAASPAVTLIEAKAYLRVTHTAEDLLITSLIAAATNILEKYTNRTFVTTSFRGQFSNLIVSKTEYYPFLELLRSPVQSITAVEELIDGSWTAVDSDYWSLRELSGFSRILFNPVSTGLYDSDSIIPYFYRVDFDAGYSTVPDAIKTAIMVIVNYAYTNRGDCYDSSMAGGPVVPDEAKLMVNKYVIRRRF